MLGLSPSGSPAILGPRYVPDGGGGYNQHEGLRTMRYKIALHKSEEGYSVCVPGFPGCWSQGETEEEALTNIEVAIKEYLAVVEAQLDPAELREIEVAV
jgi:predicted RNase H-like HicB family nuclease